MAWVELTGSRTRTGRHYRDEATGKVVYEQRLNTRLHYPASGPDSATLDGVVDMAPQRVNNAQFDGWRIVANDWHYALGKDLANHGTEDGWVGFGGRQGAHWFKFRLVRSGYLKWSTREWGDLDGLADYNRARLASSTGTLSIGPNGETINATTAAAWTDLWPSLPQGQVDAVWRAEGRQLKEEIAVSQAARDWIAANRPPGYFFPGTPISDVYFGFVFRLDWSDVPKVYRGAVEQDKDGDWDDNGEQIGLRDALERLLAFMPVDDCIVTSGGEEVGRTPLKKRLYKSDDGNHYLLIGVRCDVLNGLPAGDLVYDPTLTLQPDATAGKDTYIRNYTGHTNNNYGVATNLQVNSNASTPEMKSLLEFDCSSVPSDATCDSATLSLWSARSGTTKNHLIYSLASGAAGWLEGTGSGSATGDGATWVTYDGVNNWPGSAGASTSGTDYEASSLGTIVYPASSIDTEASVSLTASRAAGWFGASNTNYGILLVGDASATVDRDWRSSDYGTAAYRPKLVVNYTEAGGSSVPAIMHHRRMQG